MYSIDGGEEIEHKMEGFIPFEEKNQASDFFIHRFNYPNLKKITINEGQTLALSYKITFKAGPQQFEAPANIRREPKDDDPFEVMDLESDGKEGKVSDTWLIPAILYS